jgi:hypothetical protein
MKDSRDGALLGLRRWIVPLPRAVWRSQVEQAAKQTQASLGFMSADYHLVRNFVVREIPRTSAPLPPEFIARELELPVERVISILDDLERRLTFLFRDREGAVVWAYPVTADVTPHRVTISTGETVYAA